MEIVYKDEKYISLVNDILENKAFNMIKKSEHHGVSRYDHSLKVSYVSYKLTKLLGLDYVTAARGGLLHDFFVTDNERSLKDRLISTFTHPLTAAENAKKEFNISIKETNIIESHMFIRNFNRLPKYMESWLVILADTVIGTYEFSLQAKQKATTYASVALLFMLNYTH